MFVKLQRGTICSLCPIPDLGENASLGKMHGCAEEQHGRCPGHQAGAWWALEVTLCGCRHCPDPWRGLLGDFPVRPQILCHSAIWKRRLDRVERSSRADCLTCHKPLETNLARIELSPFNLPLSCSLLGWRLSLSAVTHPCFTPFPAGGKGVKGVPNLLTLSPQGTACEQQGQPTV